VTEAHHEGAPATGPARWGLFGGLALIVLVADQLSKAWVDANFQLASIHAASPGLAAPTPIIGDFVRIAKTYNDGGIFGLFGTAAPVLALASIAVVVGIVAYQARSRSAPLLLTVALGLLLGGALGNLTDRIRFGYVIDFVDMGLGGLRWYTFNVADASISLAISGLLLLALFGERWERWRRQRQEGSRAEPEDHAVRVERLADAPAASGPSAETPGR
jgi:signal peptidase II